MKTILIKAVSLFYVLIFGSVASAEDCLSIVARACAVQMADDEHIFRFVSQETQRSLHPTSFKVPFSEVESRIQEDLKGENLFTWKRESLAKKEFESLKSAALDLIQSLPISENKKKHIRLRLTSMSLIVEYSEGHDAGASYEGDINVVFISPHYLFSGRLARTSIMAHEIGHSLELNELASGFLDSSKVEEKRLEYERYEVTPFEDQPDFTVLPEPYSSELRCLDKYSGTNPPEVWITPDSYKGECESSVSPFLNESPFRGNRYGAFGDFEACYDSKYIDLISQDSRFKRLDEATQKIIISNSSRSNPDGIFPSEHFADVIGAKIFQYYLNQNPTDLSEYEILSQLANGLCDQSPEFDGYPTFELRLLPLIEELGREDILSCNRSRALTCPGVPEEL